MGRNIKNTIENIFLSLKQHLDEEDQFRITDATRHVIPSCEKEHVMKFVEKCKISIVCYKSFSLVAFYYIEKKYILIPVKYATAMDDTLGLEHIEDIALYEGACMISIAEHCIPIRSGISSLEIIDKCLGLEGDDNWNLSIPFSDMLEIFEEYSLFCIEEDRFQLQYREDFDRLYGILVLSKCENIHIDSRNLLIEILLLLGSRSIAVSIINCVEGQSLEYSFFQIYQCLETVSKPSN